MFELFNLLNTPSAIRGAISLSTPSSLSSTFYNNFDKFLFCILFEMKNRKPCKKWCSLSVPLHEANTHVFSCIVLCWLCFNSDNIPDSIKLSRLIWSFLFIFSSSSTIKYRGLYSNGQSTIPDL
jgi:hypothetical protein